MIWWFSDLLRYRKEREELDALAGESSWLIPEGWRIDNELHVIWDGEILVGDERRAISLRYPGHFPHSPPSVLPRNATERWSGHQYGAHGELCLEYGPDNWHPDISGAEMIRSAYRLLNGERTASGEAGEVPSRHQTTLGQDLRAVRRRFFITRDALGMIETMPSGALWTGETVQLINSDSRVSAVMSITPEGAEPWNAALPEPLHDAYGWPTLFIRVPEGTILPAKGKWSELQATLHTIGISMPTARFALFACGAELVAYSVFEDSDEFFPAVVVIENPPSKRLDDAHAALAARKVGIVGCGSVGSKVAVTLARSGVGKFLFVDDDVFLPENLVRHDLDWRDVARHKADAVSSRVQLANPAAKCEVRRDRLGGQESSGSLDSLIEALGACDLLVDASGEPKVFNYLSTAATLCKKPLVWGEVFAGGIGGLIARYRPEIEPDPQSIRRNYFSWCAEQGHEVARPAGKYEGGEDTPFIADDAEVSIIAGHLARFAIDILIPRTPSLFPYSVYVISLGDGWMFKEPFQVYPISLSMPSATEQMELNPEETKAEFERILDLLKEYKNATAPAGADAEAPAAGA